MLPVPLPRTDGSTHSLSLARTPAAALRQGAAALWTAAMRRHAMLLGLLAAVDAVPDLGVVYAASGRLHVLMALSLIHI